MADFIQHPVVQALAWTLVHFLWQGAAIGLAAWLMFRATRTSASARYAVGVGALAAMVAAPVATFLTLAGQPIASASPALQAPAAAGPLGAPATIVWSVDLTAAAVTPSLRLSPDVLAVAVLAWFAGVAFFAVRLLGGWIVARRMTQRAVRPAAESVQALARHLADRLRVNRVVLVFESPALAVPVMVGWLKPAVVLPMAALGGLSPAQVEALLAHELAHVRRHDYLVNLLQSVAEALLFYHPAVWWLSRRVRAERELCCDDLAVGVCDRVVYATALTDLAAMTAPRVALAATDGDLIGRVRRILGQAEAAPVGGAGVMPVLALALVAGIAVSVTVASATGFPVPQTSVIQKSVENAAQPQTTVTLVGEASARVEAARPLALAADTLAVEQTPQQQAERERKAEEARLTQDLRRALEELAAQVRARGGQASDPQTEEQIKKAVEQYEKTIEQYKKALAQLAEQQRGFAVEAQTAEQTARNAEIEALRRKLEDTRRRVEVGLASEQQLLELQAALEQLQAGVSRPEQGSMDVQQAERALARTKALYEKGLVSQAQVREAEMAVAKAQAAGNMAAEAELQLKAARVNLERAREMVAKGLMPARVLADLEAQVQALDQRVRERPLEVRPEQSAAERDRAAAEAKQLYDVLAQRRTGLERPVTERELVAVPDAAELVKAGDVLRIVIDGEPDLPNSFKVGAEGTIRMPFLGSIKVVGLTAANVRAAVGKLMSDRKLGSAAQVKVTLLRSSREP